MALKEMNMRMISCPRLLWGSTDNEFASWKFSLEIALSIEWDFISSKVCFKKPLTTVQSNRDICHLSLADPKQSLRGVQVEQDPLLGMPVNQVLLEMFWNCAEEYLSPYLSATSAGRQKRQLGEPLDQSVTPCACCFVVTADNKYIMACGYWDNSFKCFSADSGENLDK